MMFQTFETKTCIHINEKGKWVPDTHPKLGAPQVGDVVTHRVRKTFFDIWLYYANLIDYFRIIMTVVALIAMLSPNATSDPTSGRNIFIAITIMGSVLLDWVDGPVARYMGQSTIMGCGWDWLADIFAQYCLAIWCMYMSDNHLFRVFTVLFTGVEISTGIFDFAISAQSIYPSSREDHHLPWYAIVEAWLTPGQSYNNLGTFSWLANTAFPISICLKMHYGISYFLFPFAMLYAWHEVSQLIFVVHNWKETTATLHQQGLEFIRECNENEISILKNVHASTLLNVPHPSTTSNMPEDESDDSNKDSTVKASEITWVNLFNEGKLADFFEKHPQKNEMMGWVKQLVKDNFNEHREILSFGYITSPKNGNVTQRWHFDYGEHVSNLFIPLTEVTSKNGTQFIRGPLKTPMPESNYFPDPSIVKDWEKTSHLEICQIVSKPFCLFKLYAGVMHRGIANTEDYDRILFFVSTNPTPLNLKENFVHTETSYKNNGFDKEEKTTGTKVKLL